VLHVTCQPLESRMRVLPLLTMIEERKDRRIAQNQCTHPFRMTGCKEERRISPVGVANDVGGSEPQASNERGKIIRVEGG
jgi:hypothetical protein